MGLNDVDPCEKSESEHLSDHCRSLSFESPFTKNDCQGAISGKELQELIDCLEPFQQSEPHKAFFDLQDTGINVYGSVQYKESLGILTTEIYPAFVRDPSPVSGRNEIECASVECDNLKPDADDQREVKDDCISELPARSVLESKPERQKEKNLLKEITEPTQSPSALECFWRVVKFYFGLHLCRFCAVSGADHVNTSRYTDAGTYLGIDLPLPIVLHHHPEARWRQSKWLNDKKTIQRNDVKEDNLWLNDQMIENYVLEIVRTDHSRYWLQYLLKVLNSSCALADNEDLSAYKEGKKSLEVELCGKGFVIGYHVKMQNPTLHIFYERGTGRLLHDVHVQCNLIFRTIDMEQVPTATPVKGKSSVSSRIIGSVAGVAIGIAVAMSSMW